MKTKTYNIRMNDSETKGPSAVFPAILTEKPYNQDDETCYYDITIAAEKASELEAALDADSDVLSYSEIEA